MGDRTRVNARQATLAVLKVLQERTDETKPIHIPEIVEELKKPPYEIFTNRDTVKRILDDLRLDQFYPEVQCETLRRGCNGEWQDYTYGYWYKQPFVFWEAAPRFDERVKENVTFLRRVIRNNKKRRGRENTVSFHFGGYGSDGAVHPKKENRRINNVLPLRLCVAYGNPYLIGLFPGERDLAHFRVDLMTKLTEQSGPEERDERRRFTRSRLEMAKLNEYLASHLYMSFEKGALPQKTTLRISKKGWSDRPDASLTFLYDAFRGNWQAVREDEEMVEVQVECLERGIELFVWQYLDRVEVVGPKAVKEKVERALRERCEKYLDQ